MRPAVRAQRDRRGEGRGRRPVARSSGSSRSSCSWPPARLHRPARRRQRRLRAARRGVRRRRRARPVRGRRRRRCRSTRRSRSSSSSRSRAREDPAPAGPAAGARWSRRPRSTTTARARRSSRATRRPSCCCGASARRPGGLPAAAAGLDGVRRRACASSPAAASTRATSTTRSAWAGPPPAEWAARLGSTRRRRGRWCAPRCARRSRSPACCWPARRRDDVVADTTGDDWEADRVALESRELAMTDFLDPARAGAAHRPARRLGRLADPGLRAEALPHLVLRRRCCPRASAPATCRRSPSEVAWLPARTRSATGRRRATC